MHCLVAHSIPGRLRVRYPHRWLKAERGTVESRLHALPGVRDVVVSTVTGSVRIDYDPARLSERRLIDELGGRASSARAAARPGGQQGPGPTVSSKRTPLLGVIGSTATLAATFLPVPGPALAALLLASEVPALLRASAALGRGRVDGTVLEASTLALLVARGDYTASALLTWLRSVGEYIVARAVVTARRSLSELVAPRDHTAVRVTGTSRRRVRVASLKVGDVILTGPGRPLPVDGTVTSGEALVNHQTITGEALPVERRAGDRVFAGTTIEHGHLRVRVDSVGPDTAVGRIVHAIESAAEEKSDVQVFAERLADREVARTLGLAVVSAGLSRSIDAGVAVLVADYGLAARVGIPTAILASIRRAATGGILIKGPRALETLARVDTVVFDKTGTLTLGTPRVTRVVSYAGTLSDRDLVRLAAAAESGFRHPVARAITRLAAQQGAKIPASSSTTESVGLGVDVDVEARRLLVGSHRFMESRGIDLSAASADEAAAHAVGASLTFLALDGRLAGMIQLEDELRADARSAVAALRARRMRNVILLSGDHAEPSRVIAESLGLRHHYADLLPEDKARLISALKAEERVVAMVGDGVNDALALRTADVGIAVPGGAPIATEVADVVLLRGGLDQVVRALDVAGEGIAGVRRTLEIASQANWVVAGLAAFGLARPVTSILLSHGGTVAAAIVMAARPSRSAARGTERQAEA